MLPPGVPPQYFAQASLQVKNLLYRACTAIRDFFELNRQLEYDETFLSWEFPRAMVATILLVTLVVAVLVDGQMKGVDPLLQLGLGGGVGALAGPGAPLGGWVSSAGFHGCIHGPLVTTISNEPEWSKERLHSLLFGTSICMLQGSLNR